MKRIIWSSVFLLFGIMVVAGGIMKLNSGDVECGGRTMHYGQTCVSTSVSGEEVGSSSLEDQKAATKFGNYGTIGVAVVIVVIAAQNLKIGIQRRKKKESEPLPGSLNQQWDQSPPVWQQQAPQQQYQPHQQYSPQQHQPQQYQQQAPPPHPYQPQQPGWGQPQPGWGPQQGHQGQQGQQQGWGPQG